MSYTSNDLRQIALDRLASIDQRRCARRALQAPGTLDMEALASSIAHNDPRSMWAILDYLDRREACGSCGHCQHGLATQGSGRLIGPSMPLNWETHPADGRTNRP